MNLRNFFLVAFVLAISGTAAEGADRDAGRKVATQRLSEGRFLDAFTILKAQLDNVMNQRSAALAVFQKKAGAVAGLINAFDTKIDTLASIDEALQLADDLEVAHESGVIPGDAAVQLRSKLDASVADKAARGELTATFGDPTKTFPSLAREPALSRVYEATLSALRRPYQGAFRSETAEIFAAASQDAALRQRLEADLSSLVFSVTEIEKYVAVAFPTFAASRTEALKTRVVLTSEPSRRLIEVDVGAALSSYDAVQVVEDRAQAEGVVQIAELQYTERAIPQTTRTVTIAYHETDLFYAVVQMPKNASFLYEVVEGGTQVDWAYEVSFTKDGQTRRKLIRDAVNETGYQCINPRIVNVFGGVIKSPGWPNKKTAEYCQNGTQAVAPTDVRNRIIKTIAQTVDDLVRGPTAPL